MGEKRLQSPVHTRKLGLEILSRFNKFEHGLVCRPIISGPNTADSKFKTDTNASKHLYTSKKKHGTASNSYLLAVQLTHCKSFSSECHVV